MCLHRLVVLPLRRCLRIVVHVGRCLRGDDERDDSGNECESPAIIHREGSTTRRALRPCLDAQNASNYAGTLVAPPITHSSSRNGFVVHLWVISRRNRFRDKFLDQPSVFAFRYITALFVTYTGESTSCCVLPRATIQPSAGSKAPALYKGAKSVHRRSRTFRLCEYSFTLNFNWVAVSMRIAHPSDLHFGGKFSLTLWRNVDDVSRISNLSCWPSPRRG